MNAELLVGLLAGLLIASLLGNFVAWYLWASRERMHKLALRDVEDARRAAEIRSGEQLDAMLDRISTSPRIEVLPAKAPPVNPEERLYFSDADSEAEQEAWNEYRERDGAAR